MFFDTSDAMWTFVHDLPGRYDTMKLFGVRPEDFAVYGHMAVTK